MRTLRFAVASTRVEFSRSQLVAVDEACSGDDMPGDGCMNARPLHWTGGHASARIAPAILILLCFIGAAHAGGTCQTLPVYNPPPDFPFPHPHQGVAYETCMSAPREANLGGYMRDFIACVVDGVGSQTYRQIWRIKDCEANNQGFETKYGYFTYGQACAVQPAVESSVVHATGSRQCHQGCEYEYNDNGDGTSTAVPTGDTCAAPAFDPGKNNQCRVTPRNGSLSFLRLRALLDSNKASVLKGKLL
jgi:hypothetical protein